MGIFLFLLIRVLYFLYKYKDIWIDIDLRQFLIEKKIFQEKCVTNILECFHEQNTPHAQPPPGYTLKHGQYENG